MILYICPKFLVKLQKSVIFPRLEILVSFLQVFQKQWEPCIGYPLHFTVVLVQGQRQSITDPNHRVVLIL